MTRKSPSKHSDAQFALFVEEVKNELDGRAVSEFDRVVRWLVGAFRKDLFTIGHGEGSDGLQGNGAASSLSLAATLGSLPEPPTFDVIESDVHETGASPPANLLVLVGHLAFGWLINESLLISLLMLLLPTDEPSAVVVFSFLTTTRARLDLVSNLAWIKVSDRATRLALDQVFRLFIRASQIRNELLPAIEKENRISLIQQDPIDRRRLNRMAKACREMSGLNRKIWNFCRGFEAQ